MSLLFIARFWSKGSDQIWIKSNKPKTIKAKVKVTISIVTVKVIVAVKVSIEEKVTVKATVKYNSNLKQQLQ